MTRTLISFQTNHRSDLLCRSIPKGLAPCTFVLCQQGVRPIPQPELPDVKSVSHNTLLNSQGRQPCLSSKPTHSENSLIHFFQGRTLCKVHTQVTMIFEMIIISLCCCLHWKWQCTNMIVLSVILIQMFAIRQWSLSPLAMLRKSQNPPVAVNINSCNFLNF